MASVLITKGILTGQYFGLPDEPIVSIGRDNQCTLQLLDPTISRKHLQLTRDANTGARRVADYRSANGVEVNGERITMPVPIKDGDQIKIGDTVLTFLETNHPDAKSAQDIVRRKKEWKRTTLAGD